MQDRLQPRQDRAATGQHATHDFYVGIFRDLARTWNQLLRASRERNLDRAEASIDELRACKRFVVDRFEYAPGDLAFELRDRVAAELERQADRPPGKICEGHVQKRQFPE